MSKAFEEWYDSKDRKRALAAAREFILGFDEQSTHRMTWNAAEKHGREQAQREILEFVTELSDDHSWDDFGLIEEEILPRLKQKYDTSSATEMTTNSD